MILVPEFLFVLLIYLSLIMTAGAAILLVVLLIRDFKRGKIW